MQLIRKHHLPLDIFTACLTGIVLIVLASYFSRIASAWLDNNYLNRLNVTITNTTGGSAQTNYQVQVSIDTASLISAGKIKNNCYDMRFGNNLNDNLSFWRESACSTTAGTNTIVWVTIPSISEGPSTLVIYMYYNYSGETVDGSSFSSVPSGLSIGTGADGACSASSSVNLNSASCAGRGTADAVNFSSTANTSADATSIQLTATSTGLAVGDEVLIINLKGTSGDNSNVGKYETRRISSITTTTLSNDTLNFANGLTNAYNGTTQKIMVQRVPQYTTVTVNDGGSLTASAWDGSKGGVVFFRANNTVAQNWNIASDEAKIYIEVNKSVTQELKFAPELSKAEMLLKVFSQGNPKAKDYSADNYFFPDIARSLQDSGFLNQLNFK